MIRPTKNVCVSDFALSTRECRFRSVHCEPANSLHCVENSLKICELARTKQGELQVVSQPRRPTQLATPPVLESVGIRTAEAAAEMTLPSPPFSRHSFKIAVCPPDKTTTSGLSGSNSVGTWRRTRKMSGDLALANSMSITACQRFGPKLIWFVLLLSTIGCGQTRYNSQAGLGDRILPPPAASPNTENGDAIPASKKSPQETSGVITAQFGIPRASDDCGPASSIVPASAQGIGQDPAHVLSLAEAIETAFRQQPRLRVFMEGVEQARRGEDIAFAPFLPMVAAGARSGVST